MLKKYLTLTVIIAMALPGILTAMTPSQGLPEDPGHGPDLLLDEPGAGAAASGPASLHLVVQTFDPLIDTVLIDRELTTLDWDGLFLLQFVGPVLPDWTARVEALGCRLGSYIPDNAFITRMTPGAREAVVDLPFVRWVGPYHPGLRVDPELWQRTDPLVGVAVVSIDDVNGCGFDMLDLGAVLDSVGTRVVQGLLPRASILPLARSDQVEWIEPWLEPELHNDNAARLISARTDDGPYVNTTFRMWSYDPGNGTFNGTTGAGYIVSAADTGLDDDHPSFLGHIPTINYVGGSTTQDTYGHGTHVLGTAAGTGIPYPNDPGAAEYKYIGVAPEANVFMEDIFEGFNFYRNFDVLGKDASEVGAVVNSNSWGEYRGGRYTANEVMYDTMVRDAQPAVQGDQPLVFCFSAGNGGGGGDRTVASPASAKNIITVGATGNDKNGVSGNTIAGFSSRGPTADNRVKPDVVASGAHVVSAAAWPHSMPFVPPPDGGQSWTSASGTSMSCPTVAGAVALVYDWCESEWGHTPSPAMVKALLINGADVLRVDPVYPGTKGGWGRVNLTRLPDKGNNYRTFFYDQITPLRVGGNDHHRYIYALGAGNRVWITLVWTDVPASANAAKALVSDLDLIVRTPDGRVYRGNNFNNLGHSLEGADLGNDSVNNVEKVFLPQVDAEFVSVEVVAKNTPSGPQDFALVVQGDVRDKWRDLVVTNVSLSREDVDEGDTVVFSGDMVAMGTLSFAAFDYEIYVLEKGSGTKTTFDEGTITGIRPWESRHFSHRWTAVRGDWEFVAEVDTGHVIKEFSEDNNRDNRSMFVKGYGLLAELIPPQVTVWPGLEAHLEVNVLNTGNVPDTYSLSTEGIPVGWHVVLDQEDITLGVDNTGTIIMRVEPPPFAKAGAVHNMHVEITSLGNSTYSQRLEHRATVGQVFGLEIELADEQRSVFPGLTVVHTINITNTGNGEDTYDLLVERVPPGWTSAFSVESVTIEDNVTTVVQLEMETPVREIMNTIADIDIIVVSSTGKTRTLNARTRVRQSTGMDAALTTEETVRPGERLSFTLWVFNLGNGVDVFTIAEDRPNGWRGTLAEDEVVLDAFENTSFSAELICPKNARAGTYDFEIQVASGEDLKELTVQVDVEEVYGISKVLLCGASAIYPGNETTYCLSVTSLCNLPTEFAFAMEGAPGDWDLEVEPTSVSLDPGRNQEFTVRVVPPKTTPSGFYQLKILLDYGPGYKSYENVTLYILEQPADEKPQDTGANLGPLILGLEILALIGFILAPIVYYIRWRDKRDTLPFEEEYVDDARGGRRLPPPPPDQFERRVPPPPPPPRPPETVDELLADTSVMHRMSSEYDRYSADASYASGETLARHGAPAYAGDCPTCGGKVMEHATGVLMCDRCGAQFTDD